MATTDLFNMFNMNNYSGGSRACYVNNSYQTGQFGSLTAQLISSIPNIGMSIFELLSEIEAPSTSDSTSKKTSKEEKALAKQLKQVLSKYGVSKPEDFDTKISEADTKIKTAQSNLTNINTSITTLEEKLTSKKDELHTLQNGDRITDTEVQAKITTLNQEISTLQAQIESKKTEKKEQEKQLTAAQAEKARFQTGKAEVENLNDALLKLRSSSLFSDPGYDIEKEKKDLSDFSSALLAFQSNPNATTAKALKDAYEKADASGDGAGQNTTKVNNKTAQKAWDMVKDRVEAYLNNNQTGNRNTVKPVAQS